MKLKTTRQHLNDYTTAAKNLELTEAAINILERVSTNEARFAIRSLKRGQRGQVRLLDEAAAALGAPYPSLTEQ